MGTTTIELAMPIVVFRSNFYAACFFRDLHSLSPVTVTGDTVMEAGQNPKRSESNFEMKGFDSADCFATINTHQNKKHNHNIFIF